MISVIIPTFKRRDMLFFELDMLYVQTYKDIEIIVINDDIIDDPTDEILQKYPDVRYIKYHKKIGPGQKRQVGYEMSKGEYIYTPDDDDYLIDTDFLQKAVAIMEEDESVAFVSGSSIIRYEDETDENKRYENVLLNVNGKMDGIEYLEHMQGEYSKPLSSFPTLFRKKAFEANKFMEQIEMSDVSLYMLACLYGSVYFLADFVGVYRIHSRSLTTKKSSSQWINNVMRQKELMLYRIKDRISKPNVWWLRHVALSYRFYANTSKNRIEKLKLLLWIFKHSHGYGCVNKYVAKELYLLILNK